MAAKALFFAPSEPNGRQTIADAIVSSVPFLLFQLLLKALAPFSSCQLAPATCARPSLRRESTQ